MTTSSPSSPTPPKQTPTAPAAMVRKVSFSPDQFDSPSPLSPHPNSPTKRRSSMKQDAPRPVIPPKETYQHPDPLLRRLRLRDGWGKPVNLETEFRDAQVVAILFGCVVGGGSRCRLGRSGGQLTRWQFVELRGRVAFRIRLGCVRRDQVHRAGRR